MIDQAQNLKRYIEEYKIKKESKEKKQIRVIAVASGKGGVGKTNFSVNLAISLNQMGYRVVVFDADLGLANVDVIIGAVPKYNLYDVIFNDKSIEDIIINGPEGIKIIPGGSGVEILSNLNDDQRKILSDKFNNLNDVDILIIDTGAGISKNVLGFIVISDEVIVVTTPEPTSITDAYSLIKVALKYVTGTKIFLVINRTISSREADFAYQRINSAIKKFLENDINYLGYIIDDPSVKRAVMEQKPFKILYPDCAASKCINEIASAITGFSSTRKKAGGVREFLNKVTYLFGKLK